MPRPARKLHELVPVNRQGKAYVYRLRKWVYLGRWDTRRSEPSAEAAAKLDRLRALWRIDPTAGSTATEQPFLVQLWRDWRKSGLAPIRQIEDLRRVERYLFGTEVEPRPHAFTKVADFSAPELLAWQSELCGAKDDRGELKLSRSTITQMMRQVRECFAWGVVMGKVDQAQAAMLQLVPRPPKGAVKEKRKRRGVPRELVDVAIPHLMPPLQAAVELLWLTCARPSEILGLRVKDIDRGGKVLTESSVLLDLDKLQVWAAVMRDGAADGTGGHKTDDTGYDRVVFFGPRAQAVLMPFLKGRATDQYLFRPAEGKAARKVAEKALRKPGGYGTYKKIKGAAGLRQPGESYDSNVLRKAVRKACRNANCTIWTPYQIRHSVFRLVQARFGRDGCRVYGGHQVGGATEEYAGADLEKAAEVAKAMG